MKIPRVRFTMRRMMAAVAIMAIVLGVTIERHNRFRKIAVHHRAEFVRVARRGPLVLFAGSSDDPVMLRLEWHVSIISKHEHASRYPFLPVAPDPPEPE
jgi:hypothetical protein